MTATRMIGIEIDLNEIRMMKNTMMIDTAFTRLKSEFVMFTRSLVQGASPISIADLSYFFMIFSIWVHCLFTALVAVAYFDVTIISCLSPLFNSSLMSSGITSDGIIGPVSESDDTASFMPLSFSISFIILSDCSAGRSASAMMIEVAPILNSSFIFSLACLLFIESGSFPARS